jgi:restriction endonuclease S subunit
MFHFTNDAIKAHFFIQLKGRNAGKPLRKQIPNYTGICVDERILVPDYFYYLVLNLYNKGRFKQKLKGTAVPYLRQTDIFSTIIIFLVERRQS